MDAINGLGAGLRSAQATVDAAAQQIAAADLPTRAAPDPANPGSPAPSATNDVDVAGQLTTMMIAVDMHHVTSAALRSAFSLYQDSLDLIRPVPGRDS